MGRGSSKAAGGKSVTQAPRNLEGLTEQEWEAQNARIEQEFYEWLDSKDKKAFEADQYNIFEKMTLDNVRRWMTPDSESSSRAYYGEDFIPEDDAWAILYKDGSIVALSEGDPINGVRRSNIQAAIYRNANDIMLYGSSDDFEVWNDSRFHENNDIWNVDFR